MKKILLVILDGLSDEPLKELGNKTPLEVSFTPQMDSLAQRGKTGIIYPLGKDMATESDLAVMSLLGYAPQDYYTGRGPLEAFAYKLAMHDGSLALRANFATASDDGKTIKDRRIARTLTHDEADLLAREINTKLTLSCATFEFKNTIGHRAVLVIRPMHNRFSSRITNTDPAYEKKGMFSIVRSNFDASVIESEPLNGQDNSPEAVLAAEVVNEFSTKAVRILNESAVNKRRISEAKLPANMILLRDAGERLPKLVPLESLYKIQFGAFVEMPVERAIAELCGMEIIAIPSSTGHLDVDYAVWAKIAAGSLNKYGALYIHLKGPDEPSHDGDYNKKKEVIELIDKFFFATLLEHLDLGSVVLAVTSDHATSCKTKSHSIGAVPFLVCGGNIDSDGTMSFSEKATKHGSLGEIPPSDIMSLLVKLANE